MRIPVFHADVSDDGRVRFDVAEETLRRRHLASLAGKRIDVTLRVHREKRSLDQNEWLWGPAYNVLAEAFGYDEHERDLMHYSLLAECFGTVYDPRLGREWPARTSSQLTTKEFSDYMEWLVRWAATEHGIVVPLPGESEAA